MKRFTVFVFTCLRLCIAFAQGSVDYQQLPLFPGTARDDVSAFVSGNDVYIVGGLDVNFVAQNDVWKFSGAGQAWQQMPALPAAGRFLSRTFDLHGSSCIIGGISGAYTDIAECWCYKPSQGWSAFPYPQAPGRRQHVAVSVHDEVFFGLGMNGSNACNDWWWYHNALQGWQELAHFPGDARKEAAACAWGESLFAGLGVSANDSVTYKDFYRFDIASKKWTRLADYPGFACQYTSCIQVSDGILLISGINQAFEFTRETYLYRPAEDRWTRLEDYPYPAKKGAGVASADNGFYIICGVDETVARSNDMIKGNYKTSDAQVLVFPNPFTDLLHIKWRGILTIRCTIYQAH